MSERSSSLSEALSPRQNPTKAVTISDELETISPQISRGETGPNLRQHKANMAGKRMTGRAPTNASSSSIHSISSQVSQLNLDGPSEEATNQNSHDGLLSQVSKWLSEERSRRLRPHGRHSVHSTHPSPRLRPRSDSQSSDTTAALDKLERILASYVSSGKDGLAALGLTHGKSTSALRRSSISRKMKRGSIGASSDTDYVDGDVYGDYFVPNCDAVLDNTKTLAYTGGQAGDGEPTNLSPEKRAKDKQNWLNFKQDIVRLAHTLRLKGWRRIPIEKSSEIDVERLSGALTNAVYVVSPPSVLPEPEATAKEGERPVSKKRPAKLLLRVYGPQVEHLIDREAELAILCRLSRKKIGPRLLGTFTNGRFEEFFHARTLTPNDLRDPNTSKHIAKRMRELHDGVELLEEERNAGPFVFKNWDRWVDRCEQVITWLDKQVLNSQPTNTGKQTLWRRKGLVLGVEWPLFRRTVEEARKYLYNLYGGSSGLREKLVFAHNDTQYGNLLRLTPSGESPLLLPANNHKQLIVIDFEYSSANPPANEFANHFTEWCYNYHDTISPHKCVAAAYPTLHEQRRFLRAYVEHRPQFNVASSSTPKLIPSPSPNMNAAPLSSSISSFMLDSRAPPGGYPFPSSYDAEEKAREEATEKEVQRLLKETRQWRMANSAMWIAWGIVQAQMPEEFEKQCPIPDPNGSVTSEATLLEETASPVPMSDPLSPDVQQMIEDSKNDRPEGRLQEKEHHEGDTILVESPGNKSDDTIAANPQQEEDDDAPEFDYLAYAQDRALFFWADALDYGVVKKEDLPEELLGRLKKVDY